MKSEPYTPKEIRILSFIKEIRESHPEMENIFLFGSCMNFWCILKNVWPESERWYNHGHIITKIGSRFYDITGEVDPSKSSIPYDKFEGVYSPESERRAEREMYLGHHKIR